MSVSAMRKGRSISSWVKGYKPGGSGDPVIDDTDNRRDAAGNIRPQRPWHIVRSTTVNF